MDDALKAEFLLKSSNLNDEFRRIFREQLALAISELNHVGITRQSGIHKARVCLKRLRACYQLLKQHNNETFKGINRRLKEASSRLSPIRDSEVMLEIFETVYSANQAFAYKSATSHLYNHLHQQSEYAQRQVAIAIPQASLMLRDCQLAIESYSGELITSEGFYNGIRKVYKRSLSTWKTASKSTRDEDFHQCRKAVKYHMYHVQLLQMADKRLKRRTELLDKLSGELGSYHDLCILGQHSKKVGSTSENLSELLGAIKKGHLKNAGKLVKLLFSENSSAYMRKLKILTATLHKGKKKG